MEVTLILTEACNLRCKYCYQQSFPPSEMPVQFAVEAIRSAVAHGARSVALTFFGGEPLLKAAGMFEILSAARRIESDMRVPVTAKVSTNGVLLTDEVVRQAGRLGLFISLSMDGTRAAQDAGRRTESGESCFDEADEALRLLVRARRPFAVYSVVTPQNAAHLAASADYLWGAGARLIVHAIDYTAAWDGESIGVLKSEYIKLGKLYQRWMRRKENFHLEPFDSRIAQVTRRSEQKHCAPGVRQVTVAPDGRLYGCIEYFHRRYLQLGNVCDWLDADRVRQLVAERRGGPAECRSCGMGDRCNRSCACVNLRGTGRVDTPPESVCRTEQAAISSVDAVASRLYRRKTPAFLMRHYSCNYHLLTGIERLVEDMEESRERVHAGQP